MDSSQEFDDVEILTKEGSVEVSRRNINKAINKYKEAYKIARKSGKHEILILCACNLGAALLSQGDSDSAVEYLEHAVRTLEAEKPQKNETLSGDILFNLGLAYAMRKDFHTAVQHFSSAGKVFQECDDFKGLADSCQQLGEQYMKLTQPLRAAECFRDASEGYLNAGRAFLAGKMVVRQAQNLHSGGNSEKSVTVLQDLEKLYSQIRNSTTDSGKLAKLICDTGSLLFQLRSPESASIWLHRALDIMKSSENSDEKLQARILLILGEVCCSLGDFTKAVTINKEASVLYGKLDDKKARGQSFYQLAEAYRHLGDHHHAERYYHIAYQTLEDAGLHSLLWQVLEGLADLNYQRHHLDTSISYYKETITQLSYQGAPHSIQRQIVSKLASALEVQRVGVVKAASYKNRIPVLIQPQEREPMSFKNGSPDVPVIQSPIYAPLTSTRLSLYSSIDHSGLEKNDTLAVPGRKKRRKSKRHGRRRSGSFDLPVFMGVDEYDTETDVSLVSGTMARKAKKARKTERSKLARLQSKDGEKLRGPNKSAPRRLLSHIKGLEIEEDGAAPPTSSDSLVKRQRSVSTTVMTNEHSSSSSSDDDDEDDDEDENDDDSLTEVSSDDGTGSSSEDDSSEDSSSSEEELKHLDDSPRSRLGDTYEHPSVNEPMYATIKSRKLSSGQVDEKLYETLNSPASTGLLTSTIPKRTAPSAPSPPDPPTRPRPSQRGNRPSLANPELAGTSRGGPKYPESSTMGSLSRGQREMGLYQVARLAKERQVAQSSRSSMSSATSEAKVPKSKVCVLM